MLLLKEAMCVWWKEKVEEVKAKGGLWDHLHVKGRRRNQQRLKNTMLQHLQKNKISRKNTVSHCKYTRKI